MKKNVEKKIRKGGLVKLNDEAHRQMERTSYQNETPCIWGKSKFTEADAAAYRADIQRQIEECKAAGQDAWHVTMRDDGESRLPPTSTSVRIYPDRAYQVLRARCVGHLNYTRHPGQCLILDLETGREVWVYRYYVEAV